MSCRGQEWDMPISKFDCTYDCHKLLSTCLTCAKGNHNPVYIDCKRVDDCPLVHDVCEACGNYIWTKKADVKEHDGSLTECKTWCPSYNVDCVGHVA